MNLRLSISRSLINRNRSNKNITYNFSSLSAKIFDGDIFDCEFYHGPSLLIGYYYEHTNFRPNNAYYPINNATHYQSSSMISTQYQIGLEREIDNILLSGELGIGTHLLFNDDMTILAKYNMYNFVPYVGFSLYVGYRF